MVIDEFGDKLSTAQNSPNRMEADGFLSLKDLFSDCDGVYLKQAMADTGNQPRNAEKDIIKPFLSIVGISTPDQFKDALDKRSLEGGFINRLITIHTSEDKVIKNFGKKLRIPDWFKEHLKKFYDLSSQGNLGHGTGAITFKEIAHETFEKDPSLIKIPFSDTAVKRIIELDELITEKSGDDEMIASLTVR
ncbi:MAG TPA: hypothetical protein EYN35_08030 [Methylococcales bacterium]|nr:hypothetical protein [Methylococcales bacterium]